MTSTPVQFTAPTCARIGQKVRAVRTKRGLTQLELAAKAFNSEVSHCRVSRVERAVHPTHSLNESVRAIAKALGVSAKSLMA